MRSGGAPGFLVVPFVAPSTQTLAAPSLSPAAALAPLGAAAAPSMLGALPAVELPAPPDVAGPGVARARGTERCQGGFGRASLFDRLLEDGLVFPTSPLGRRTGLTSRPRRIEDGRGLVVPKDGGGSRPRVEPGTPLPTGEAAGARRP